MILQAVVDEYIKTAFPISSDFLQARYFKEISPATIRLELADLADNGFLQKAHISSGRVPTDKGYRFFVDNLLNQKSSRLKTDNFSKILEEIFAGMDNDFRFLHDLSRTLANVSSSFSMVGFDNWDLFWKEGWQELARVPEFNNGVFFKDFTDFLEDFESEVKNINFTSNEKIKIYIGQELPFKQKDFSVVLGQGMIERQGKKKIIFSLLGPKRMDFRRNISLMSSLVEMLERTAV